MLCYRTPRKGLARPNSRALLPSPHIPPPPQQPPPMHWTNLHAKQAPICPHSAVLCYLTCPGIAVFEPDPGTQQATPAPATHQHVVAPGWAGTVSTTLCHPSTKLKHICCQALGASRRQCLLLAGAQQRADGDVGAAGPHACIHVRLQQKADVGGTNNGVKLGIRQCQGQGAWLLAQGLWWIQAMEAVWWQTCGEAV